MIEGSIVDGNRLIAYHDVFLQHVDGGYMTHGSYFGVKKPKLEYETEKQQGRPPVLPRRYKIVPLDEKGQPIRIHEILRSTSFDPDQVDTCDTSIINNEAEYIAWLISIAQKKQKVALLEVHHHSSSHPTCPSSTAFSISSTFLPSNSNRYLSCREEYTTVYKPRASASYRRRIGSHERFVLEYHHHSTGGVTFSFLSQNGLRMHYNYRFWNCVSFCTKSREHAAWIVHPLVTDSTNSYVFDTTEDNDYVVLDANTDSSLSPLARPRRRRRVVRRIVGDAGRLVVSRVTPSYLYDMATAHILERVSPLRVSLQIYDGLRGCRNVVSGVTGICAAAVGAIAGVRTGVECLPMDGGQVLVSSLGYYATEGKKGVMDVCEGVTRTARATFSFVDVVAPISKVNEYVCRQVLDYSWRFFKKKSSDG